MVTESFQLGDQAAGVGFGVTAHVPVGSEVAVGLVAFEHPVRRDQDRVRDRDLGSSHPATLGQPGVLDGEVVTAPFIYSPILGCSGMITGTFSENEASRLAALLGAGPLPASWTILELKQSP